MLQPKYSVDLNPVLVFALPMVAVLMGLEVAVSFIPWLFALLGAALIIAFVIGATVPTTNFSISNNQPKPRMLHKPNPLLEYLASSFIVLSFIILALFGQPLVLSFFVPFGFYFFDREAKLIWDEYISDNFRRANLQALTIATILLFLTGILQVTFLEQIIVFISIFFFALQVYFWRWKANNSNKEEA